MTIETQHSIGDTVYHASSYGYDKDIIKAIKVTGEKRQKIQYGFTVNDTIWGLMHGDGYNWYTGIQIFTDEDKAAKYAEMLAKEKEKEEKAEKEQELIKRKAKLKAELEQLEAGVDPDEAEDY